MVVHFLRSEAKDLSNVLGSHLRMKFVCHQGTTAAPTRLGNMLDLYWSSAMKYLRFGEYLTLSNFLDFPPAESAQVSATTGWPFYFQKSMAAIRPNGIGKQIVRD